MRKVKSGDTLSIIAPANTMYHMPQSLVDLGVKKLATMGLSLKFEANVNNIHFHTAGTLEERLFDFHHAMQDPDTVAVMAVYGGYNSNQLLEGIDYQAISSFPKVLIGYSDITALSLAIYAKTGVKSLYGPSFASFCDPYHNELEYNSFRDLLFDNIPVVYEAPKYAASDLWYLKEGFGPRDYYPHPPWKSHRRGVAEGILLGGNLETILALAGTEYLPDFSHVILLIEGSCDEKSGKFDRELTQLRQMGILSQIDGMIIGQFSQENSLSNEIVLEDILTRTTAGYHFPIIANASFSHATPILSLPVGGMVRMFADDVCSLTIVDSMFSSHTREGI